MIFHSRSSGKSLKERSFKNLISSRVYLNALKGNFKLEWVLEVAWVVQDYNITDMDLGRDGENNVSPRME